MDPLSVTASILAIVGAATQVTKGLAKVRALHYAPAELSALINEVSDLRAILSQVATFGNQLEEERLRGPVVALRSHLTRARAQLRAVDNLINTELFKVKADGTAKISRTAWIRVKPDVDMAQRELAGVRVNIGTALGVVTS
jgi:light-regulated signal transduction histidine kinase (bacteriophytochrome)